MELTSAKVAFRWKKARASAAVRWPGYVEDEEGTVFEKDAKTGTPGPGMAAARRRAIRFFYVKHFGWPPEPKWGGRGGIILPIMRWVGVPEGPKDLVRKVPEDVADAQEEEGTYNTSSGLPSCGRSAKITTEVAGRMPCTRRWGRAWGSPRRLPW